MRGRRNLQVTMLAFIDLEGARPARPPTPDHQVPRYLVATDYNLVRLGQLIATRTEIPAAA